ncbi:MAG: hypothetical protein HZA93_29820 [Verrucomicrobia bacterium]|nr:hypothetical protein [Verrucomicrobiota bacterium]
MNPSIQSLTHRDWASIDQVVLDLFAEGLTMENYVTRGLAAVQALVPGEFATYSRAKAGDAATFEIVFSTTDSLPLAPLQSFMGLKDHYWLWHPDFSGTPGMRSDFFSDRSFRDQPLYTDAYRPFGLDNHLCIPVMREDGSAIHFSVQRFGGPDFTERDRAVVARLQPHLASARRLARTQVITQAVRPESFRGLGLTPRETEVFCWLVEGKRNSEIATILRLREQTVKAHVAEIFRKLRVENRHSAMRAGWEAVRCAGHDELAAAGRTLRAFQLASPLS